MIFSFKTLRVFTYGGGKAVTPVVYNPIKKNLLCNSMSHVGG